MTPNLRSDSGSNHNDDIIISNEQLHCCSGCAPLL
jgi:hypothetical protein